MTTSDRPVLGRRRGSALSVWRRDRASAPAFGPFAEITRLLAVSQRLSSVSDLALQTMIHPLTLCVHEVDTAPTSETLGIWRTDQLFLMLDEFSAATLERVDAETDAQFIVELVPTLDPGIVTVLLRESIVVMAQRRINASAGPLQWEAIASHFASMIDAAAECYASPLTAA